MTQLIKLPVVCSLHGKVAPLGEDIMKTYHGHGVEAPHFLFIGTRRMRAINFTHGITLPEGKKPLDPMDKWLGPTHS
jgi:hypothetical protein